MPERKQINFTIVPDEPSDVARTYANFCAISHTPFDFTLTFCEVLPPSETEVREADGDDREPDAVRQLRAPVRARIVVPAQFRSQPHHGVAGARARLQRGASEGLLARGRSALGSLRRRKA